jgi:hypothetical protein
MTRPDLEPIHIGHAGHFVGSNYCRFHLHTHVGPYCVSTVGDYWPRSATEQEPIGYQRTYETMVWTILSSGETSMEHIGFAAYNTPEDANEGHAQMVRRWLDIARGGNN